jgi:hypothetical protein
MTAQRLRKEFEKCNFFSSQLVLTIRERRKKESRPAFSVRPSAFSADDRQRTINGGIIPYFWLRPNHRKNDNASNHST